MTYANRELIHSLAEWCVPGSPKAVRLDELLDMVEGDRAHAEAQKLLGMHMETLLAHGPQVAAGLALAITVIDPYVMRDGVLVHKVTAHAVKGGA